MTKGETYRVRAAQLLAQAKAEPSDNVRHNFVGLARAYLRLAEQADQNAQADLTYETPRRPTDRDTIRSPSWFSRRQQTHGIGAISA